MSMPMRSVWAIWVTVDKHKKDRNDYGRCGLLLGGHNDHQAQPLVARC